MRHRIWAAILCVLLGSCGQMSKLSPDYTIDEKAQGGVVVVSLTFEGSLQFSAFTIEYRLVGSGETQAMRNVVALAEPDFESDGRRGWLFPRELPPGEYEFYRWRGELGNISYWSPKDFSNRFTVSARRATYVGNLNVRTVSGRYQVQVRDERERDLREFRSRYPRIRADLIEYDIMTDDMSRPRRRKMGLDDLKDLLPGTAR